MPTSNKKTSLSFFASKKNTALAGTAAILVLFIALFLLGNITPQDDQTEELTEVYSDEQLAVQDTDGDGIPDWRELLLGTSPTAYDSDNDGVGDADIVASTESVLDSVLEYRVRQNNPDASDEEISTLLQAERSALSAVDTNTTARTAQDLYVRTSALGDLANLNDPTQLETVLQTYQEDLLYNYPYPQSHPIDYEVIDNYGYDDEQAYVFLVLQVIEKNPTDPDPIVYLENYLSGYKDGTFLQTSLRQNITQGYEMITNLLEMSVPDEKLLEHVDLTNALIRVIIDIELMSNFEQDALSGYAAMLRYQANLFTYREATKFIIEAIQ